MQVPYSSIQSLQIDNKALPSLMHNRNRRHLPNTIKEYVTEVNQELINLEKEYGISLKSTPIRIKLRKVPTIKRRQTYGKSSSILPAGMRHRSNSIKPIEQIPVTLNKNFKSSLCLPNPRSIKLKKCRLLEELKSLNEESTYMNQNLLTDMITYDDTEKKVNKQFNKIKTNKQKLLLKSDEYLKPEIRNPFYQNHANDFYSYLDQVIEKVNGSTSIDLFKKMKMLNDEKEKEKNDSHLVIKNQKKHEIVAKLLEESNQIKNRLSKNY